MLAEFLDRLVGLTKQAHSAQFLETPKVPSKVWLRNGDDLSEVVVPPETRDHELAGYDDLVRFLSREELAPSPEVYIGPKAAFAYLDGVDRAEWVSVPLTETTRFQQLIKLQTPRGMAPRDVVRMLRFDFHACNVDHVIQAMSRIDFTRTSSGKTDVAHGRETLGRAVEAAVQQADAVPKTFAVSVPVWSNPGFGAVSVPVEIGVHLDLEQQVVVLQTLPDEIERARNLALITIAKQLREDLKDVPVFLGAP